MTGEEQDLANAIQNYREVLKDARKHLDTARENLCDHCTHPEAYVTTYTWEHDNGYGRQSMIEGLRCELCLKRKPWKTMGSWEDH